jgi:hypothetical protein
MKDESKYKIVDGTAYHQETNGDVIRNLEWIRKSNTRVRLVFGDVKTGISWKEIYDVAGTIGRSTGKFKIPILLHNVRSMGGGAILDNCIIGIRYSNKKEGGWIYRHKHYFGDE